MLWMGCIDDEVQSFLQKFKGAGVKSLTPFSFFAAKNVPISAFIYG